MPYIEQDNWKRWLVIGMGIGALLGLAMAGIVYWMESRGAEVGNPTPIATATTARRATPTQGETSIVDPIDTEIVPASENAETPHAMLIKPIGERKTGYYNEQQLFEALIDLAQDRGLLLSEENGVVMENGTITLFDINRFFEKIVRTEIVVSIYVEEGEAVAVVLKAESGGTAFPEALRQGIEADVQAGFSAELKNDFQYTSLDTITIEEGKITIHYYE